MTFPTINYKYNGNEETKHLSTIVDQKLNGLVKFIPENASASCNVEFEKNGAHFQGRIYRAEVNLTVNGTLYRAEATEESFERAIDVMRDELNTELSRAKDRQVTKDKARGRSFKELLSRFVK
jgi:ribosomal subunit interface protein